MLNCQNVLDLNWQKQCSAPAKNGNLANFPLLSAAPQLGLATVDLMFTANCASKPAPAQPGWGILLL